MRPLAIDLFGAGGGMAMAMLLAGFAVVGTVDGNPVWAEAIRMNLLGPDRLWPHLPEVVPHTANLLRVAPQRVATALGFRLDALSWAHFSPPCQAHSFAGRRERRGTGHDCLLTPLTWARARPAAYITAENVVGVEDSHRWASLVEGLRRLGRETFYSTYEATWYGDPQHRERVWVVSAPPGLPAPPMPAPTVSLDRPRTWEWAMRHPCPVEFIDDMRFKRLSPWQADLLPFVPQGGTANNVTDPEAWTWVHEMYPESMRNFVRRFHAHRPAPTILTGTNIVNFVLHCHPTETRPSTIRELARLQSFPDRYIFPSSLALANRLIGEAVPLGMGTAFARTIREAIG